MSETKTTTKKPTQNVITNELFDIKQEMKSNDTTYRGHFAKIYERLNSLEKTVVGLQAKIENGISENQKYLRDKIDTLTGMYIESKNEKNKERKFSNAFRIIGLIGGLVIGAAIVYFLGTQGELVEAIDVLKEVIPATTQ